MSNFKSLADLIVENKQLLEQRTQLLAACKEYREKLDRLQEELVSAYQRADDEHG